MQLSDAQKATQEQIKKEFNLFTETVENLAIGDDCAAAYIRVLMKRYLNDVNTGSFID